MKPLVVRLASCAGVIVVVMTLLVSTVLAAADASAENRQPPVKMGKFTVSARHLLCFGIAIELWEDKSTQRVMEMYVKDVQAGSMAEEAGLAAGTRIYGINGIPVDSLEATFGEGSELNRIFVDRKEGDCVTLEIKLKDRRGTKFVTLVEHRTRADISISPLPIH